MQHDILFLVEALTFAKDNFEHTTDEEARCRFIREDYIGDNGEKIRREKATFDRVTITSAIIETRISISVDGCAYKVSDQIAEINAVTLTYQSCKPGLPSSDRRNKKA